MRKDPTTPEEASQVTYGPPHRAVRYDPTRCVEGVWQPRSWGSSQCCRKPGHGPGGLYCKQHDPAAKAARDAKRDAEYRAERERENARFRAQRAEQAVIDAAIAATRQTGTWDAVAEAVFALEKAREDGR
jgi:hypothetical protein